MNGDGRGSDEAEGHDCECRQTARADSMARVGSRSPSPAQTRGGEKTTGSLGPQARGREMPA
jgi:hypothetical protein